jgi:hypothetical protein
MSTIIKLGEATVITTANIQSAVSMMSDSSILERFKKVAAELKTIAPKADDFLYFSAIMMHAAEASLLDDNSNLKKDATGNDVTVEWKKDNGSWRWVCSDSNIKPYRNSNSDIFPEEELIKAHKKWVGKPLCLDHKSSSVDMIRGVIVDTYYDYPNKRVIALCALDKKNYPDLARKVSTGYAASVSMGTAVGKAICFDCGQVATVESEFCNHMRGKTTYGEINVDLNPIELSIVVNGADPRAKIRHIVAAANSIAQYIDSKEAFLKSAHEDSDLEAEEKDAEGSEDALLGALRDTLLSMRDGVHAFEGLLEEERPKKKDLRDLLEGFDDAYHKLDEASDKLSALQAEEYKERAEEAEQAEAEEKAEQDDSSDTCELEQLQENEDDKECKLQEDELNNSGNKIASLSNRDSKYFKISSAINSLLTNLNELKQDFGKLYTSEENNMTNKKAYFQGGGGVNEPTPGRPRYEPMGDAEAIRDTEDKQMTGLGDGTGPVDGLHPGDAEKKRELQRMAEQERRALRRQAALERAKNNLAKKEAYYQGGGGPNEPQVYPKEPFDRDEDRQMNGSGPFPEVGDTDGLYTGDLEKKEKLLRAKLSAKFVKAASADGTDNPSASCWQVFADDKLILTATVAELAGNKADVLYDSIATKQFGRKILSTIRTSGFAKAAALFKGAQPAEEMPEAELAMPEAGLEGEMEMAPEEVPEQPAAEAPEMAEEAPAEEALAEEAPTPEAAIDELEGADPAKLLPDLVEQAKGLLDSLV